MTAAESGVTLQGAFVTALDQDDRVVRSALTDETGRTVLPVGGPGRFRVKAELIGRETQTSPPLEVEAGQSVTVPLILSTQAVSLAEIRVEAESRCELRPAEASEIARVWGEAGKALAVQAWVEREGVYRLEVSTYERDLDRESRRVVREDRRATRRLTRVPFASLPPEDLVRGGFVRALEDGGYEYHGPDAAFLLSDEFLDTHCLRLTRSADQPGGIGLAFEPVGNIDAPDIRGTLWLDEATAGLRFIEYAYTWAPYREAEGVAEGRVEYASLPDGAWVIDRWWIRAPILARDQNLARAGDSGIRVSGIRETGGEVGGVSTLDRSALAQARRGSLSGVVWDSVASGALAGATVHLSGTAYRAETDSAGRFRLEGLPAGVYTAGFTHPRLDSLGIEPRTVEAAVAGGGASEIALAIPSPATILLAACQADEREAGGAVLSGVVTDRTSGRPLPGARVRVEWQEVRRVEPVLEASDHFLEVRTDNEGRYTACGIPVDAGLNVVASFMERSGDTAEATFAEESHQALNLAIELPPGLFDAQGDVTVRSREYGAQGVQGVLFERETGSRIRAAEVTVLNAAGEVIASGETNGEGFFRLTTPAPGRYLLSARALGYGRIDSEPVDVSQGNLSVLEVRMAPEALALEPIVVMAERRAYHLEMEGFYRRQMDSGGAFISPEELDERRPERVTTMLFGLAGTRVAEPSLGTGGRAVYFRGGERSGGNICWPMVYVDRHLVSTGGLSGAGAEPTAIDDVVAAADVLAIEVFRTPAEVPSEFNGPNAGCGVIVLWTRRGGGD